MASGGQCRTISHIARETTKAFNLRVILGFYYIGVILYWGNIKLGSYYIGVILHWGNIGTMENQMETTILVNKLFKGSRV